MLTRLTRSIAGNDLVGLRYRAACVLATYFAWFAANHPVCSADLTFHIVEEQSPLIISGQGDLGGPTIEMQPQFSGSLTTYVRGDIVASGDPRSRLSTQNAELSLRNLPQLASPGAAGVPGSQVAQAAAKIATTTPIPLPEISGFNLGTLKSLDIDGAMRDSSIRLNALPEVPIANGVFDASQVQGVLGGAFDYRGNAVLKAANLASYFAIGVALSDIQSQPDSPVEDYSGDLSAREYDVLLAGSYNLDDPFALTSSSAQGTLSVAHRAWRMTLPVAFSVSETDSSGILTTTLHVEGSVLAQTEPVLLAGDGNGDGKVDLLDFGLLRSQFGTAALESDYDASGRVDLADFGALRENFGKGPSPVPESTFPIFQVSVILFTWVSIQRSSWRDRCWRNADLS